MPSVSCSTTTAASAAIPVSHSAHADPGDQQHRGGHAHPARPRVGSQQRPGAERVRDDDHEPRPPERDPGLRRDERGVGDDHRGERQEQPEHPEAARAPGRLRRRRGGERDEAAGGHDDPEREDHGDHPAGPPVAPHRVPRPQHQLQPDGQAAADHQPDGRLATPGGAARDERDRQGQHPHGDGDGDAGRRRTAPRRRAACTTRRRTPSTRGADQQGARVGCPRRPPDGEQQEGRDQARRPRRCPAR